MKEEMLRIRSKKNEHKRQNKETMNEKRKPE